MDKFNKNQYLVDLKDLIREENPKDVWEFVHQEIENAVIYYADCMDIVKELNFYNWGDDLVAHEFGEIKNICHLAYVALFEYVQDNIEL